MYFDGKYFDWNKKKLKKIVDFYGHQFFSGKKVLDLGCGHADISGPIHRFGAEVTAVDARQEHLFTASKKYPGIKIIKSDLDRSWSFNGKKFDVILDLGLLCHLLDYEKHLRDVCSATTHLILETAVCDYNDEYKVVVLPESKGIYDSSVNGNSSRPTAYAIERVLRECGMSFQRIDDASLNSGLYKYDWKELNNQECDFNKRRLWICVKDGKSLMTAKPVLQSPIKPSSNLPNILMSEPIAPVREAVGGEVMSSYQELSEKRVKFIISMLSPKYFFRKTVFDAGAGNGEIGAALTKLGAGVTAADVRQEHLAAIRKKHPNIRTARLNFESTLSITSKFDITLSIDTLCHLNNFEQHLRELCARSKDLILETAVCDSSDPNVVYQVSADTGGAYNAVCENVNRPSAARIERILAEQGMGFTRLDSAELNYGNYVYDWKVSDSKKQDSSLRRFWICSKRPQIVSEVSKKNYMLSTSNLNINAYNIPVIKDTNNSNNSGASSVINYNTNRVRGFSGAKKKFVIVIPSYKNERWADKNILSALNQNYDNYRIIYTDDCSPDNTFNVVKNIVESHKNKDKVKLIKNSVRKGALENLYDMIHSCDDDEIIATLDGDDWLANENVLNKLNEVYQEDVWLTYGQYQNYPDKGLGLCRQIPNNIIDQNKFRNYPWCSSHLRTFYTWLFKSIKKEDLMYNGRFAPSAWDMYIMFPMLEMSKHHSRLISDVLYIYNLENPINDHKVDQKLQANLDGVCRLKSKYQSILQAPKFKTPKTKIGLLLIATGKYDTFLNQIIQSADQFFFNDENFEVKYFIFTDSGIQINTSKQYEILKIDHKSFPYASMDRFKHFTNNAGILSTVDYLYYVDVDCKFVSNVSSEILGNLVGVRHCGFFNGGGTFEDNPKSVFYNDPGKYKHYYGGGFSGGKSENYLGLSKWCYEMIEKDLSVGVMPRFHDETSLNSYFLHNPPDNILSPSYHYPQGNINHYKNIWRPHNFEPKILLLEKNHKEIRS